MGDYPCVIARQSVEQTAAVDLKKSQQHVQSVLDFSVEAFGRNSDEAGGQIGDHLLEPQAISDLDTIKACGVRGVLLGQASLQTEKSDIGPDPLEHLLVRIGFGDAVDAAGGESFQASFEILPVTDANQRSRFCLRVRF